jgi:AraC-like DNA-binding protein
MSKSLELGELEASLNFCAIYHCAPDWCLDENWASGLSDYDLWYVWGGLGRMLTSDGPIDLYPGLGVWMRPGRRYEATHDPKTPLRVTAVHFQLKNKNRLLRPKEFIPPVEVFEASGPAYFEAAMRHVVELRARSGPPEVASTLLKSLLLEIVDHGARAKPDNALDRHHKLKLNPIIALIREQPGHRFIVQELAGRAGYSTDHFVRLFQAATGQSPKEFMIAQRLERAVALLKGSSHTVTQIAGMLGYEDLGFFSRQFKENIGTSPDHFRRRGEKRSRRRP